MEHALTVKLAEGMERPGDRAETMIAGVSLQQVQHPAITV